MKVASSKLKVYFSHLSIPVYLFYFVTENKSLLNVSFESASKMKVTSLPSIVAFYLRRMRASVRRFLLRILFLRKMFESFFWQILLSILFERTMRGWVRRWKFFVEDLIFAKVFWNVFWKILLSISFESRRRMRALVRRWKFLFRI